MSGLLSWNSIFARLRPYRAKLRFCLRVTISGLAAFAFGQAFSLPLSGLWAVLTAVIVTQMSAGGSLRASIEYMVGTLGGVVYAAIIGVVVPHSAPLALAGVLALTIAPLALAAAIKPSFRVAPFSAVLVLLLAGPLGQSAVASAVMRISEVALGAAVAVTVSFLAFPERAHGLGLEAAISILERMARFLPELLQGCTQRLDPDRVRRIQDQIGEAVAGLQTIAAEGRSERLFRFVADPDQGPLSRSLLRMRHDFVIIGRATAAPLPEIMAQRLGPMLKRLSDCTSDFLLASATALRSRKNPPSVNEVEAALTAFTSEFESLRRESPIQTLSETELEQVFALGFALDQLYRNFGDLERCVREYAHPALDRDRS